VKYKNYVDISSKDMATLALHVSGHPKGLREGERFWHEEGTEGVRGNDTVPSHEEPHKSRPSTKSRNGQSRNG